MEATCQNVAFAWFTCECFDLPFNPRLWHDGTEYWVSMELPCGCQIERRAGSSGPGPVLIECNQHSQVGEVWWTRRIMTPDLS